MWSSIEINRGAPQSDPIRPRNNPVVHPGSSRGRIIPKDLCSYILGAQNGSHGTAQAPKYILCLYIYICMWSRPPTPPPILTSYALAPSACSTTCRCRRSGSLIAFHSFLRIGPGPGARKLVRGGFRRINLSELGLPLSTILHHCSHLKLVASPPASSARALPRST